jgi:hypothetical protein
VQPPNPRQDFGYQLSPNGPFFLVRLIHFSQQARGLFFLKPKFSKTFLSAAVYRAVCLLNMFKIHSFLSTKSVAAPHSRTALNPQTAVWHQHAAID